MTTVVVHDVVRDDAGELVEDTYDWYAQDRRRQRLVLRRGHHGLRGRQAGHRGVVGGGRRRRPAGIAMLAHPDVGDAYRQEYRQDVAEDHGKVLSLTEKRGRPPGT